MSKKKQKDKLIIDTDKLYKYMKSVEGYKDKIYACSSGVPTIGVGFALLIKDTQTNTWSIRENLFSDSKDGILKKAGITLPKKKEIKNIKEILENVVEKLDKDNKEKAKKIVKNKATILNKLTINNKQSKELFKIIQDKYEGYLISRVKKKASGVDKAKAKKIIKALSTDEQIAAYSSCYTSLTVIGSGFSNAIKNYTKKGTSEKDKAYYKTKAWYEMRYNSHKSGWKYIKKKNKNKTAKKSAGDDGLANRRYKDSLKFGLYELYNGKDPSQKVKDGVLKFLKSKNGRSGEKVKETIKKYEKEFSPSNKDLGDKKQDEIKEVLKKLEKDPVKKIKNEAENNDRELDNLSYNFLKKYDEKYGIVLDEERPIYHSVKKIEKYNDILIFPLMNKLVINAEKEEKRVRGEDDELYKSIKGLKNRCKETLEEVIKEKGGYKRLAYKNDNNKDLEDRKLKEKLIDSFKPKPFNAPDTKKSHEFFKSFITKEDKEKQLAKKEEKEKQKRKEELEKIKEEKEKERKKRIKLAEKRRKEAKERIKKREGFIIVYEDGGHKLKRRKDHYGV